MKLIETRHCHLLDGYFGPEVVAGFTKTGLAGVLPDDLRTALSYLQNDFQVGYLKQIHSSLTHRIHQAGIYEGDGLFTHERNLAVAVRTADCLPLIFYSQLLGVIGVVHMGWRGAAEGILSSLPYDASSFKVIAGPGLRLCCYEVGESFLKHTLLEPFVERRSNRFYFDPIAFARSSLMARGLLENNFHDMSTCSICSAQDLFSYRKNKTFNRHLSFIVKL
ncbi:MAG: polyphenol oxidase family protein [Candidatus Omnitrophota bacterium]